MSLPKGDVGKCVLPGHSEQVCGMSVVARGALWGLEATSSSLSSFRTTPPNLIRKSADNREGEEVEDDENRY